MSLAFVGVQQDATVGILGDEFGDGELGIEGLGRLVRGFGSGVFGCGGGFLGDRFGLRGLRGRARAE